MNFKKNTYLLNWNIPLPLSVIRELLIITVISDMFE